MRLKSFEAPTMQDALRQVTKALGRDAVIVSSREMEDGSVRVTAAIDSIAEAEPKSPHTSVPPAPLTDPSPSHSKAVASEANDDAPDINAALDTLVDGLYRHGVPSQVTERITARCELHPSRSPSKMLSGVLDSLLGFTSLAAIPRYILIGQPGHGKTTVASKLATQAVMSGQKPLLVNGDYQRAGAAAQLDAIAAILEIPTDNVSSVTELSAVLDEHDDPNAPLIIDTPGTNSFDGDEMKALSGWVRAANAEPLLIMSAGLDAYETAEIARAFAILGAKKILPSRLDVARRYGGLVAAADTTGMAFCALNRSSDVSEPLQHVDSLRLAGLLLPTRHKEDTSHE